MIQNVALQQHQANNLQQDFAVQLVELVDQEKTVGNIGFQAQASRRREALPRQDKDESVRV